MLKMNSKKRKRNSREVQADDADDEVPADGLASKRKRHWISFFLSTTLYFQSSFQFRQDTALIFGRSALTESDLGLTRRYWQFRFFLGLTALTWSDWLFQKVPTYSWFFLVGPTFFLVGPDFRRQSRISPSKRSNRRQSGKTAVKAENAMYV